MNLFDLVANSQGGSGIDALARKFNLSTQQAEQAVEALLPAFSQGLKRNTADPNGFGSFLSALASGQHARYSEDAANAFSPQGKAEGDGILGHLFGSSDVSRAVAEQASQATGIGQQVLKQMLPAIATMLMGGMARQTNERMAAGGFGGGSGNPLGELIEQMMRQGGAQQSPQTAPQQPQGGDNPFGKMLEDILGGVQAPAGQAPQSGGFPTNNPLGDILGQILRGGQPQGGQLQGDQPGGGQPSPRQAPGSGNPWGDILGQILGGGQSGGGQSGGGQSQDTPQRSGSNNPLEDIFGKMAESGKQVSDDYQKGINDIFEQYRRGMDRRR